MATRLAPIVAGLTLAGALCGRAAASPPSIALVAFNQAGVAADTLTRAKTEVTRIFGESSVGVTWMEPATVESGGAFAIQILVRTRAVHGARSVMGTAIGDTHETGGSAFVYYDRVLQSAHQSEQDVACLFACTIVHEIGHVLLPRPAHSSTGIMRAGWDGDDLRHIASRSLTFTPTQVAQIRSKLSCCSASTSAGDGGMIGAQGRAQATSGLDVTAASSAEAVARVRSTDATILELLNEGAEGSTSERGADARWDAEGGTTSQSWVGQTAKHRLPC